MQIEFDKIAEFMGELCGAARHDFVSADPADVGLYGIPVRGWREAYFEGCKDMAEGITAQLPEEYHETVREIARKAFSKAFEAAKNPDQQDDRHD